MLSEWFLIFSIVAITRAELKTEPVVEMRWDFNDCNQKGRMGPTQSQCELAYKGTSLEGDVMVDKGVQIWTAPVSGLFLITAKGPSGLEMTLENSGRGAIITAEFRIRKGENFRILVGQQSDYDPRWGTTRGPGGSGGTFVTRNSDSFVMLVAGGGSSGAGRASQRLRNIADAGLESSGKSGSRTVGSGEAKQGAGGVNGTGGTRGVALSNGLSSSGGGAGFDGNGASSYINIQALQGQGTEFPQPSIKYTNKGYGRTAPGVGGLYMFTASNGEPVENNGGFGGGGSGSSDGGAGGGGGYSGGGGGPPDGWGGGGGSANSGDTVKAPGLHVGRGSVSISFTGHACCGPVIVYIAMCFVAGIIFCLLVCYLIYRCIRMCKEYKNEPEDVEKKEKNKFSLFGKKKGFYSVFDKEKKTEPDKKEKRKGKKAKAIGQYTNESYDDDGHHGREYNAYDHRSQNSHNNERDSFEEHRVIANRRARDSYDGHGERSHRRDRYESDERRGRSHHRDRDSG